MAIPYGHDHYFLTISTSIKAENEEVEGQWETISQALTAISDRLKAMSQPLRNRGSQPPNRENLEEIEDLLEKLYPAFSSLKKWLKARNKKREKWVNLLSASSQITSISSDISEVKIKALLGDYMQNRGKSKSEKQSSLIEKRILVGLMLVKLAEEIESASS